MSTIVPQPASKDNAPRRADTTAMLADWHAGMRQVDIAAKYGISQGYVSRLIGTSPKHRRDITQASEPFASGYRARCLLALALVNHRRTDAGLSAEDTAAVRAALRGEWDAA